MGRPNVLKFKNNTRANFCKNKFYLATIKHENGAVAKTTPPINKQDDIG